MTHAVVLETFFIYLSFLMSSDLLLLSTFHFTPETLTMSLSKSHPLYVMLDTGLISNAIAILAFLCTIASFRYLAINLLNDCRNPQNPSKPECTLSFGVHVCSSEYADLPLVQRFMSALWLEYVDHIFLGVTLCTFVAGNFY